MKVDGKSEVVELIENKCFVMDNQGEGYSARIVKIFAVERIGSGLDWDIEYPIPGVLLDKLAEPFTRRKSSLIKAENLVFNQQGGSYKNKFIAGICFFKVSLDK
jgi:hypothetical protein